MLNFNPQLIVFSLIILAIGFILGIYFQNRFSNKAIETLSLQVSDLKLALKQLKADYDLLLQAMHGAKIQAENYQRELFGTNVLEIQRHEDPEKILNRHLLADYIYKKLNDNFSKSDQMDEEQIPGDPKVLEAIEAMDDRVVDILADVIK